MVAQTKPLGAAKQRMVAARRRTPLEPGRAGALRLALLSTVLAIAIGFTAYLATRHIVATARCPR